MSWLHNAHVEARLIGCMKATDGFTHTANRYGESASGGLRSIGGAWPSHDGRRLPQSTFHPSNRKIGVRIYHYSLDQD